MKHSQKGFTLIELSIVIVVIGLIVAGIIGGQSLVTQAKLRSIISEKESVKVSVNAFRAQYNAVPGDFSKALSYWTGCAGGDADDCNGDGNKKVDVGSEHDDSEVYRFWEHLTLSGIYPGSYTGEGEDSTNVKGAVINVNVPASKFSTIGISVIYDDSSTDATAGDGNTSEGRDIGKNVAVFGSDVSGNNLGNGTALSVVQVESIDVKSDDGQPTTGDTIAVGQDGVDGTDCITGTAYNLDATDLTPCAVAFTL